MTKDEILDYFKDINFMYNNASMHNTLERMIDELTEPHPRPVLYGSTGYADGNPVYDEATCPNCSYFFEEGDKDWLLPFCPCCGQALDWGNEK